MAVGDVVSDSSAVNTILTFQPAVGVEVMITSLMSSGLTTAVQMQGAAGRPYSNQNLDNTFLNSKILITNSLYLYIAAVAGNVTSYTGIQIK